MVQNVLILPNPKIPQGGKCANTPNLYTTYIAQVGFVWSYINWDYCLPLSNPFLFIITIIFYSWHKLDMSYDVTYVLCKSVLT